MGEQNRVPDSDSTGYYIYLKPGAYREEIADHIQRSVMPKLLQLQKSLTSSPCSKTEISDDDIKAIDSRIRCDYVDFEESVEKLNSLIQRYEKVKQNGEDVEKRFPFDIPLSL